MAPNTGCIAFTNLIISSLSLMSIHSGKAFMPPNALNKTDFPSITGIAPSGPILPRPSRSEEHTSELQSQFHLVCRLLLEKKKNLKHLPPVQPAHHLPVLRSAGTRRGLSLPQPLLLDAAGLAGHHVRLLPSDGGRRDDPAL